MLEFEDGKKMVHRGDHEAHQPKVSDMWPPDGHEHVTERPADRRTQKEKESEQGTSGIVVHRTKGHRIGDARLWLTLWRGLGDNR